MDFSDTESYDESFTDTDASDLSWEYEKGGMRLHKDELKRYRVKDDEKANLNAFKIFSKDAYTQIPFENLEDFKNNNVVKMKMKSLVDDATKKAKNLLPADTETTLKGIENMDPDDFLKVNKPIYLTDIQKKTLYDNEPKTDSDKESYEDDKATKYLKKILD
jgi:hypothetical protein